MPDSKRTLLVTYDIQSPERLRKIAAVLEKIGRRFQKSVFIIPPGKADPEKLLTRLNSLAKAGDEIAVFPLCKNCLNSSMKNEAEEKTHLIV